MSEQSVLRGVGAIAFEGIDPVNTEFAPVDVSDEFSFFGSALRPIRTISWNFIHWKRFRILVYDDSSVGAERLELTACGFLAKS